MCSERVTNTYLLKEPALNPLAVIAPEELVSRHVKPGASLLAVLHAIQDEAGFIPPPVIAPLARAMNLSHAEVHGVITYYPHFRTRPAARVTVQLCRAESCRGMGVEALAQHIEARTGCRFDTEHNPQLGLESVYCLGQCARSPAMMINDTLHANVTPQRFDALLDAACAKPAHGPVSRGGAQPAWAGLAPTEPARVFVPSDSSALALGANALADAIVREAAQRGIAVELVRNGSRGLLWLEPLVEIQTPAGRIGYSNLDETDLASLFDAGWLTGGEHPRRVGLVEEIPYLQRQQRLTFARIGITDPLSIDDYLAHEGLAGLSAALAMDGATACETLVASGLRGRGGAAFPAGIKWRTVRDAQAARKYVVCNADEGDSGTFSDRLIMESDPYSLIEGMIIAGIATGATQGYIYVRSEYPHSIATLETAIDKARAAGWLGANVLGSAHRFELTVARGAGAYICGEETAMLESLEGKRGMVRAKPPVPALKGLFGQPSVINNVITLATVPVIFARGAEFYRDFGVGRSRGTLPFQLAGNVKHGGLVELAFGITLRELLFDFGGGTASGRPARAVQVGGPLGTYLPESQWDIPLDYEAYAAAGAVVGHGGLVVHDDTSNLAELAQYAMRFCALESCGKCTPCRIGSTRGAEVIERIRAGDTSGKQVRLLRDLCDTMVAGSLCAMGGMTPNPVLSALDYFPEDFGLPQPQPTTAAV
jgi:formate dehydrogenase iron-sulfur subunit